MADVYEQNLAQKSTLTTSDFIRVVGSDNVSYKQNVSSVMETMGLGTAINNGTDLNTLVLPANDKKIKVYRGEDLSQMTNKPSAVTSAWPFCLILLPIGGAYTKQILHIYGTDATPDYVYVRTQTYSAGSVVWTDWQQSPLNIKTALAITVDSSIINNPSTVTAFRVGNVVAITLWGTTFSSGGNKSNVIRGVPRPIVNTTATFGLGGTNAYVTQGNMFIYSSDTYVNFGIRTDYAGGGVFGTLMYLAQ